MTTATTTHDDLGVLRWGGLAGILGGVLFILVFVIVGVFVPAEAAEPAGAVAWFPDVRAARTVENGLYLVVLVLWAAHVVALGRALDGRRAPALFGSVLGIMGLTVLAAGALPHAASVPISDLYHAPGATAADQATLDLTWQAMLGIFDALLITGLVILPPSLVLFGSAMLGTPAFGKRYGRASVALGVVAGASAIGLLVDPESFIAVMGVFSLIAFHLIVGWKTYRLSASDDGLPVVGRVPAGEPLRS